MNLYLAGIYTANFNQTGTLYARLTDGEKYHRDHIPWMLESYHYIHKDSYVQKIRRDGRKVFLDSGAFSAFTKGVKVDLKAYCDYIKKNIDIIDYASVLDAIGDPQGTYINQIEMEKQGVRPLPCFHYGEDERYLEYYISNYEYITLGGMVPISTPQLKYWLDRIWERYLIDGSGRPRLKVHGFGLTVVKLMERYPWFSVDSSSWVQISSNGSILIPDHGTIGVSEHSPLRKNANMHYDSVAPAMQEKIREILDRTGFEVERLRKEYVSRWTFNIWAFNELNRRINENPCTFKGDQLGLFYDQLPPSHLEN